jgi:hypothetical protein
MTAYDITTEDDVEPPYINAWLSAFWVYDLPDDISEDDIRADDEMEEALVKDLGLDLNEIVDGSVSANLTTDVTWGDDDEA